MKPQMTFDEVVESLREERKYQDEKWGTLEQKQQSVAGFMLIIRKELEEAEDGWMKNRGGRHSPLAEIRQVAAVAIACLEQYGDDGSFN